MEAIVKSIIIAEAAFCVGVLAGCNIMHGLGTDIEQVG
jgi:predicted small secreted protein